MSKEDETQRTLKELRKLKGDKKKFVIWNLSKDTKERVEELYFVEDYLYEIRTKHLKDIRTIKNEKLKEQHFAFKQSKKTIVRELKEKDKEEFIKWGVKFRPVKYKIHLA